MFTVTGGVRYLSGVWPPCGETLSHEPPSTVIADAVQNKLPEPRFKTPKLCEGGALPPLTATNDRPDCVNRAACSEVLTVSVTAIEDCPALPAEIEICPLYVPGASPFAFA